MATIHHGDCLEVLRGMADASVDAVVTDPPYGLSFMGKKWDYDVPSTDIWRECLRVLKPGGHLLAFAGTRTQHRMAVNIEDAGFEIRDMIAWVYGSGFPKSLNIGKAINKIDGVEFDSKPAEGVGFMNNDKEDGYHPTINQLVQKGESSERAKQWEGWGTALKPALEPITVARKPFAGTVAANVLEHGTGALNIDGCRVDGPGGMRWQTPRGGIWSTDSNAAARLVPNEQGRWPANLIHDGSDEVVALFPNNNPGCKPHVVTASDSTATANKAKGWGSVSVPKQKLTGFDDGDNKSAARFFYCAKASKADRDGGLDGMDKRVINVTQGHGRGALNTSKGGDGLRENRPRANTHPTVKPTALMRYLCRLVTPPKGIVLDPFMGSGSTGKAAMLEGFQFIGIEREAEYVKIAKARIDAAFVQQDLFAA